jgi:hypothetical protein
LFSLNHWKVGKMQGIQSYKRAYDIRRLVDDKGLERKGIKIRGMLRPLVHEFDLGGLPQEMEPRSPEHAHEVDGAG